MDNNSKNVLNLKIEKVDFALLLILAILLFYFFNWNEQNYKLNHPKPSSNKQASFYSLTEQAKSISKTVIYQSNLGQNNELVSLANLPNGTSINFSGFSIGKPWQRPVSWHLNSPSKGEAIIKFPKNLISHIAVYLTDGDSIWRMNRINSGEEFYLTDNLHNGRWVIIPISNQERDAQEKKLEFIKLTGDSVSISAIAFLS